jgi:hypothetical protein
MSFHSRQLRPRTPIDLPLTSLMWPDGITPKLANSAPWENDLGLNDLVNGMALSGRYATYVRQILATLVTDPAIIRWRQAVMSDCIRNPGLVAEAQALLPRLAALQHGTALLGKRQRNLLLDTADHLAELEAYVQVVDELHKALSGASLKSEALLKLRASLAALMNEPNFQSLRAELPELRAPLERISSLTVGINLDAELKPISAVLMAINDHAISEKRSWLERVIGTRQNDSDETGIAPLHRVPDDPHMRPLTPLFQDLDRLLTQIAAPVAKALTRYARTGSSSLAHLEYELAFYTGAARMIEKLRAQGMIFCQAEIAPVEERVIEMEALVNIGLALRGSEKLVSSSVEFGSDGRIAVLTGPNSGGKTTYLRSVGLAQVMFQAGLLIPARSARISPADALLTHFPSLETRQQGRLAEESLRLRELFQRTTVNSLVLLNETFSSTSPAEAVYLAQDILCAFRVIGARVIYATHLIELADRLDEIEAAVEGDCRLFSLVAGVVVDADGEATPTYHIARGHPHARSYAQEIARKLGISLDQILQTNHLEPQRRRD